MSHLAHLGSSVFQPGTFRWGSGCCHGDGLVGAVVENGTTVQSLRPWLSFVETTTTRRFFTISGGLKPVSKSQINTSPREGWKGSGMGKKKPPARGAFKDGARASLESPIRTAVAVFQAADSSRLSPETTPFCHWQDVLPSGFTPAGLDYFPVCLAVLRSLRHSQNVPGAAPVPKSIEGHTRSTRTLIGRAPYVHTGQSKRFAVSHTSKGMFTSCQHVPSSVDKSTAFQQIKMLPKRPLSLEKPG